MSRAVRWVIALSVLAATAVLVALTPNGSQLFDQYEIAGRIGERIAGQDLEVEVLEVRLADRMEVIGDEVDTTTAGVWVVVDAIVWPTEQAVALSSAQLRLGPVTYDVSRILGTGSLTSVGPGPGIPQQGTLAFEVNRDVVDAAGWATILFITSLDSRLNRVPTVVVDLASLEVLPSVEVGVPFIPEAGS